MNPLDPASSRTVKLPLPVSLIRRMDEAVSADKAGFRSRAELVREAIENLLVEIEFDEADPEPVAAELILEAENADVPTKLEPTVSEFSSDLPSWEREELKLADLAGTRLTVPERKPDLIRDGKAAVDDGPLLGLHNRDYVSIWALNRLAAYTLDGSIEFDDYLRRVTTAAWYYGGQLKALQHEQGAPKLTVLFPTNTEKRPSAERGFQTFAVGSVGRPAAKDTVPVSGPLFAWNAIQIGTEGELPTGLTESGWQLLSDLRGVSLELPHGEVPAWKFLNHLAEHAPGDRWGFDHLLGVVDDGPDREGLVSSFSAARPEWTASTASSVAQGYVARAREWGLLEPRLVEGRYWLTRRGRDLADELETNKQSSIKRGESL